MNTAILLAALLWAQTEPAQRQPNATEPAPTASAQSEAPWFYTQVIVPFGVGALGSLVTLVIGIWQIKHTEWYRRASRWEPYAEQIWQVRQKVYLELYREYWSMFMDAKTMISSAVNKSAESDRQAIRSFIGQFPKVVRAQQGIDTIASGQVIKSLGDLVETLSEIAMACTQGLDDEEPHSSRLNQAQADFVNALREDLQIESLDTHFSEAMRALESLRR